ncbi:MAG: DUF3726 domain-containing protein [Pseudomonadota bacterium]
MSISLGEVQSLSVKAARGAGMEWGLAEEAGMAARWLCVHGLQGVEALSRLLQDQDGGDYASSRPQTRSWPWYAEGQSLCPIKTGAAICDRARLIKSGEGFALKSTAWPILLVPFLASTATLTGGPLQVSWQHVVLAVSSDAVSVDGDVDMLMCSETSNVTIKNVSAVQGEFLLPHFRASPDEASFEYLTRLAHRTYAPETEQSRLSGAGAGLADND